MSRRESQKNRRKAACSVEQLDDRTLLSVALLQPVAAAAPVAQVAPWRFVLSVHRITVTRSERKAWSASIGN